MKVPVGLRLSVTPTTALVGFEDPAAKIAVGHPPLYHKEDGNFVVTRDPVTGGDILVGAVIKLTGDAVPVLNGKKEPTYQYGFKVIGGPRTASGFEGDVYEEDIIPQMPDTGTVERVTETLSM